MQVLRVKRASKREGFTESLRILTRQQRVKADGDRRRRSE
jgi:hypothetical protein